MFLAYTTVDLHNNELEYTDICDPWMLFYPHFDIQIQSHIDNIQSIFVNLF